MLRISSIEMAGVEFDHDETTGRVFLELPTIDTDGREHQLVLERAALTQLWTLLQALKRQFPGPVWGN